MNESLRFMFLKPFFYLLLIFFLQPIASHGGDLKDIWDIGKEAYCMIWECESAPVPPPKKVQIGFLAVIGQSTVSSIGLLKAEDRLCGPRKHIENARLLREVFRSKLIVMPSSDLFTGLQTGACTAALLFDPGENKRYPAGITDVEFVPIYVEESLYISRKKYLE